MKHRRMASANDVHERSVRTRTSSRPRENTALGLGLADEWGDHLAHVWKYPGPLTLSYHSPQRDTQNNAVWLNFGLEAIIPALGVLLEFLSSRFARWVNVGFFVFGGFVSAGVGIWNWSNPNYHARPYLQLGLLALVVAVMNYLLYRTTSSTTGRGGRPFAR